MTHEQPLPKDAVSPYPLDAEAQAEAQAKKEALAAEAAKPGGQEPEPANRGRKIGLAAAGAAIGSAAIAAALLYYNRSGKGAARSKPASKGKPKRRTRGDPSPANED